MPGVVAMTDAADAAQHADEEGIDRDDVWHEPPAQSARD